MAQDDPPTIADPDPGASPSDRAQSAGRQAVAEIGTAVGGGAGAGVVAATKGDEVVLPEGAALETKLRAPFTVTVVPKE